MTDTNTDSLLVHLLCLPFDILQKILNDSTVSVKNQIAVMHTCSSLRDTCMNLANPLAYYYLKLMGFSRYLGKKEVYRTLPDRSSYDGRSTYPSYGYEYSPVPLDDLSERLSCSFTLSLFRQDPMDVRHWQIHEKLIEDEYLFEILKLYKYQTNQQLRISLSCHQRPLVYRLCSYFGLQALREDRFQWHHRATYYSPLFKCARCECINCDCGAEIVPHMCKKCNLQYLCLNTFKDNCGTIKLHAGHSVQCPNCPYNYQSSLNYKVIIISCHKK